MKKNTVTVKKGDEDARVKVTFEGEDCPDSGVECRFQQMEMLKTIANNPELQNCGYWSFQTLKMYHSGNRWVLELSAEKPLT
jgi:hypothetical protein